MTSSGAQGLERTCLPARRGGDASLARERTLDHRRAARCTSALLLGIALLLFCALARAEPPRALVIGSNEGLASEPILEYAEQDARRMARIFADVAGIPDSRIQLLTGRPLGELKAALSALSHKTGDEIWLFVSGHADARGLHVRGQVWPWRELRAALEELPAKRRLGFIDACNSGAVLTAKGISFESQLRVRIEPKVRGLALLTSSGSNELSYESRQLAGSPFAHFLASGLRGAADQNLDGQVTLAEVYTYLYSRTVAASLGGQQGPQHPTQAGWYLGQGEWTLTRTRRDAAALRLGDARLGQCFVLDPAETSVIAELRPSDPAPVQLAPERYRIKCFSGDAAFAASVELRPGTTHVESLAFSSVDRDAVLARGPGLVARQRLALALGVSAGSNDPEAWTNLAWVTDFGLFAYELQLGVSHAGRVSPKLGLYGNLPWWTVLGSRLDAGLSLAYATSFEDRGQVLFGPLVQLHFEPSPRLRVFLRQEVLRAVSLSPSAEDSLPLLTTAGVDWSFDR